MQYVIYQLKNMWETAFREYVFLLNLFENPHHVILGMINHAEKSSYFCFQRCTYKILCCNPVWRPIWYVCMMHNAIQDGV